ncbi:uncharacterized protein LOC117294376 [Asterias rubens]|uniref:uncharacterized protein LOC117294376 n=1 Tax=Asterias rubens TaxID=7604 RepID=UPI001455BE07|nr:uncharacterized protein LOC117294376 [Asterias rubens]
MDANKFVTSCCVGNIWGLYSIILVLFGVVASISASPTGTVITQASTPDEDQSLSDSSTRPLLVTYYARILDKTLQSIYEDFVEERFTGRSREPKAVESILMKLPDRKDLFPNIVLTSRMPSRMWMHVRILRLFNRSMDGIIFDENKNNASYNFGSRFYDLQRKIESVLAGVLETIHNRGWEEDDGVITHNADGIFTEASLEIVRDFRCYTVLSYFKQYLQALVHDIPLL